MNILMKCMLVFLSLLLYINAQAKIPNFLQREDCPDNTTIKLLTPKKLYGTPGAFYMNHPFIKPADYKKHPWKAYFPENQRQTIRIQIMTPDKKPVVCKVTWKLPDGAKVIQYTRKPHKHPGGQYEHIIKYDWIAGPLAPEKKERQEYLTVSITTKGHKTKRLRVQGILNHIPKSILKEYDLPFQSAAIHFGFPTRYHDRFQAYRVDIKPETFPWSTYYMALASYGFYSGIHRDGVRISAWGHGKQYDHGKHSQYPAKLIFKNKSKDVTCKIFDGEGNGFSCFYHLLLSEQLGKTYRLTVRRELSKQFPHYINTTLSFTDLSHPELDFKVATLASYYTSSDNYDRGTSGFIEDTWSHKNHDKEGIIVNDCTDVPQKRIKLSRFRYQPLHSIRWVIPNHVYAAKQLSNPNYCHVSSISQLDDYLTLSTGGSSFSHQNKEAVLSVRGTKEHPWNIKRLKNHIEGKAGDLYECIENGQKAKYYIKLTDSFDTGNDTEEPCPSSSSPSFRYIGEHHGSREDPHEYSRMIKKPDSQLQPGDIYVQHKQQHNYYILYTTDGEFIYLGTHAGTFKDPKVVDLTVQSNITKIKGIGSGLAGDIYKIIYRDPNTKQKIINFYFLRYDSPLTSLPNPYYSKNEAWIYLGHQPGTSGRRDEVRAWGQTGLKEYIRYKLKGQIFCYKDWRGSFYLQSKTDGTYWYYPTFPYSNNQFKYINPLPKWGECPYR